MASSGIFSNPANFAFAATGDFVHQTTFAEDCTSGIGVGITYDGSSLWYSCYQAYTGDDLIKADPLTGAVLASYNIDGGLGSIAYDSTTNVIWAAEGGGTFGCTVAKIQLDSSHLVTSSAVAFNAPSCAGIVDGLAYDAASNELYWSPDVSNTIYLLTTTGTVVSTFSPDTSTGCGNSGVALGGSILYEGFNGCSTVVGVDKTTHSFLFKFATLDASQNPFRDESMTCDPNTFASSGQQVMWTKDAYNIGYGSTTTHALAIAYEIPSGSCGTGGSSTGGGTGVPEFPIGMMAVLAVSLVGLLFVKRRAIRPSVLPWTRQR